MAAQPQVDLGSQSCDCAARPGEEIPFALLSAFVDDPTTTPPLHALTVDYEGGSWRAEALARHLVEWVADFALRKSERQVGTGRLAEVLRQAVWKTFGNGNDRGVPGELLLHIACRQFFGSDTVINKVVFKTASNDTYKGFDGVHVVHGRDGLELWLGEAKFYRNLAKAIRSALDELEEHLEADYLRGEFALVGDKIEADHPHVDELRRLLHPNTSLDEVFTRVCVPVLLTYDSEATASHTALCEEYRQALESELRRGWMRFKNGLDVSVPVAIRLILVPLATKAKLVEALKQELPWQSP